MFGRILLNDNEQNYYGIVCWFLYPYLLIKAKQTNKQGTVHVDINKVGVALCLLFIVRRISFFLIKR